MTIVLQIVDKENNIITQSKLPMLANLPHISNTSSKMAFYMTSPIMKEYEVHPVRIDFTCELK
jgi:hypothetical protein